MDSLHKFKLPVRPGDSSAEEALGAIMNPITRFLQEERVITEVPQILPPFEGRAQIIIQQKSAGIVWLKLGDGPHIAGEGFRLDFTTFGISISDKIPVSLVCDAGVTVAAYVLQIGV